MLAHSISRMEFRSQSVKPANPAIPVRFVPAQPQLHAKQLDTLAFFDKPVDIDALLDAIGSIGK